MSERDEPVLVQALVAQATVERQLHESLVLLKPELTAAETAVFEAPCRS